MEKKRKFIINIVFYALIVTLIFVICKYILPVMVPFIIAFLIASILQIPIRKLCRENGKKKRAISILLCILFFAGIFLLIAVAGMKIFDGISGFLQFIPVLYTEQLVPLLGELFENLQSELSYSDAVNLESIGDILGEYVNNVGNYITEFSMKAVKAISGSIVGIPGFIVKLIVMIVSTFFFVMDYDKILNFAGKCIPKEKKTFVNKVKEYVKNTVIVYLRSYTLLFLMTFVELSIGFQIIGIPYAPIVGLTVAIFDILPILGTGGILLPWAIILFIMNEIPMGIGMIVLYLIITIIRNTVEPKLVGKQIGLHPLATLISMYLGLKLLGIMGLFLFPVTLAVLVSMNGNLLFDYIEKRNE